MPSDSSTPPSQIGNYEILSKIAEGGMGAVYKGRSLSDPGTVVAIKIIPTDTAKNPVLLKRFEQEFLAASRFDHPNIVKALDYNGQLPNPFLVMEYVDGESLGQRVERDGEMLEAEAIRLMAQVCDGLHRAHKQNLIHRDIKPDNILVTSDGTAKLTDMGLVKDMGADELGLTKTGRGLGTPHFMAPEQFRDAKNVTSAADIYSLGATLYMLVTGQVPFARTSPLDCWMKKVKNDFPAPRELNAILSERLDWAIRRAMSADPTCRPASCREFLEDMTGQSQRGADAGFGVPASADLGQDLWYLAYKDATGAQRTVKGTSDNIRQNIKSGALGDLGSVVVSRTKAGPFLPLKSAAEFRDLVIVPRAMDPKKNTAAKPAAPKVPAAEIPTVLPPPVARPASSGGVRRPDPAAEVRTDPHPVVPVQSAVPAAKGGTPPWLPWAVAAVAVGLLAVAGVVMMLK